MNILSKKFSVLVIGLSIALSAQLSVAGTAEVLAGDGNKMVFEYAPDKLRVNMGQGDESYMLIRNAKMYMVTRANGQTMVIDASQSMSMYAAMSGKDSAAPTPSSAAGKVISLEASGRKETHAGIEGEVYQLIYLDLDGNKQTGELVLSSDPRARAFSQAMGAMAVSVSRSAGQDYSAAADDMQAKLNELNMGVLRYGDDMHVTALTEKSIEASRFDLPAEPMDLSGLGGLIGLPASGEEGGGTGGLGSALGKMLGK